ncbi:hypothetical protein NE237_002682 [Protea cynaroides]|uniref:NB-ARC domain-containing protein n=1 Tax=Protea cynaroides TaxID=273540 RepID=A0A9Q0GMM8_9MAGN|nr:hypothetical protein NE237_002682 [Protea cynaroides]
MQKAKWNHWEQFIDMMEKMDLWKRVVVMTVDEELWSNALQQVTDVEGFKIDSKTMDEADRITEFVKQVPKPVDKTVPFHIIHPVGLDSHVEDIREKLKLPSEEILFLGIVGMGGTGKTIIAKAVYNEIFRSFKGCCSFLRMMEDKPNSLEEEENLITLQNKLVLHVTKKPGKIEDVSNGTQTIKSHLKNKKVLIVLDNVDGITQLQYLVGARHWFGEGSRIIITTRKENLLTGWVKEEEIYRVQKMNRRDSVQLLCLHVFNENRPQKGFERVTNEVVEYAQHLPLALVVLSPHLVRSTLTEWENLLKKWKKEKPHPRITEVLESSFIELDEVEQSLFLDISCFFIEHDKDKVINILDACDLYNESTDARIRLLNQKSLLEIKENKLWMHEMIRDMGRDIVHRESQNIGERSRLWGKDAIDVWKNGTGTDKVKVFDVNLSSDKEFQWTTEVLFKMHGLRILHIYNSHVALEYRHCGVQNLNFNNLACIRWTGFPFECIPNNFHMENLAVLELTNCPKLKQVWKKTNKHYPKLKVIIVRWLPIKRLLDFSFLPNLVKLIIGNCDNLVKVDKSIGDLSKLVELDLSHCKNLTNLPSSILCCRQVVRCQSLKRLAPLSNLKHLRTLDLSWCTKINKIEGLEGLESVKVMKLFCCLSLERLPPLSNLKHLRMLDLSRCKKLKEIEGLEGLESVEVMKLPYCESLERLAPNLSNLKHLRKLNLLGCSRLNQIGGLEGLESTETINLVGCNNLLISFARACYRSVISKNFGNQNICEIYSSADKKIWMSKISKLDNFVTKQHLATGEVVQVPNEQIQGVIIRIVYVPFSSFSGIPILRVVISNCVWNSIAECGDNISISVQNDPDCSGIQIGVHFYTLQEKSPDHLQVLEAEKLFRYHGRKREHGSTDHDAAQLNPSSANKRLRRSL